MLHKELLGWRWQIYYLFDFQTKWKIRMFWRYLHDISGLSPIKQIKYLTYSVHLADFWKMLFCSSSQKAISCFWEQMKNRAFFSLHQCKNKPPERQIIKCRGLLTHNFLCSLVTILIVVRPNVKFVLKKISTYREHCSSILRHYKSNDVKNYNVHPQGCTFFSAEKQRECTCI